MLFDNVPSFFDFFPWKLFILIAIMCIIRAYQKGAQFKEPKTKAKNLVAVVTGCSGGIGKQIARELNQRGAKVYMLCRNRTNGDEAQSQLVMLGCFLDRLILKICNLASFESIRACVDEIKQDEQRIDILVCNAGIMLYPKFQLTEDGHELVWQSNYLGHFLLTQLLLPLLEKSEKGGRIVNVSALAHFYADNLDVDMIDRREGWDSRQSYARSKLAQVMQTRKLTQILHEKNSKVTINSCHPGLVYTRIMRYTPLNSKPLAVITAPFAWFFLKTPKDGAMTPLYLALSKHVDGVSGKYYTEMHEQSPSELSQDEDACNRLYEYSMAAVK